MKIEITTLENKKSGEAELNADIFGLPARADIIHSVINWQLAKRRAGTQKMKLRSEVTGTTKKPFNQKGTGNARQGSLKGPHQVGGGVAHAAVPRSYEKKLNKKFIQKGLKTALSIKLAAGQIKVIDTAVIDSPKTAELGKKLSTLGASNALFVRGDAAIDNFSLAARGLKYVDQIPQYGLNVYDIIRHEQVVFTKHALEELQKRLANV